MNKSIIRIESTTTILSSTSGLSSTTVLSSRTSLSNTTTSVLSNSTIIGTKKVKFNPKIEIFYIPLKDECRDGNFWIFVKLDNYRKIKYFELLLNPILDQNYRKKIYNERFI